MQWGGDFVSTPPRPWSRQGTARGSTGFANGSREPKESADSLRGLTPLGFRCGLDGGAAAASSWEWRLSLSTSAEGERSCTSPRLRRSFGRSGCAWESGPMRAIACWRWPSRSLESTTAFGWRVLNSSLLYRISSSRSRSPSSTSSTRALHKPCRFTSTPRNRPPLPHHAAELLRLVNAYANDLHPIRVTGNGPHADCPSSNLSANHFLDLRTVGIGLQGDPTVAFILLGPRLRGPCFLELHGHPVGQHRRLGSASQWNPAAMAAQSSNLSYHLVFER